MTFLFFPYPWIIPSILIASRARSIADGSKIKSMCLVQISSFSGFLDISNLACSIQIHGAPTPATLPSPEFLAFLTVTEIDCAHDS